MIEGDSYYYFWFDTYPMEFAVFLLDSALARGVYYHTMCANDAFYERSLGEDEGDCYFILLVISSLCNSTLYKAIN